MNQEKYNQSEAPSKLTLIPIAVLFFGGLAFLYSVQLVSNWQFPVIAGTVSVIFAVGSFVAYLKKRREG